MGTTAVVACPDVAVPFEKTNIVVDILLQMRVRFAFEQGFDDCCKASLNVS
jgi:hypothetical protein